MFLGRSGTYKAVALLATWLGAMLMLICFDKTFKEDFNQISLFELEDHDHDHHNHDNEMHGHIENHGHIHEEHGHSHDSAHDSSHNLQSSDSLIHICMTSDSSRLGGMIATINSIITHTSHPVFFHIVTEADNSQHIREWIQNSELKAINYTLTTFDSNRLAGKIVVHGGRQELAKPMNYARFFYPELFPDLHGRIIHIDDDCIVQGDIAELYHVSFRPGHIAAASFDCNRIYEKFSFAMKKYEDYINFNHSEIKTLSMDPTTCCFNAGMYVTDLDLWQKSSITEKLEHWLVLNTKDYVYGNARGSGGSQPPLLLALYRLVTPIDPLWHVRLLGWEEGHQYSKSFLEQAKLLHWNGQLKPWSHSAPHFEIWDKYFVKDPTGHFSVHR